MTYWCEFLAHIDDGQAIKVNILNTSYTFFIKNNIFGEKNINYNQIAVSDVLKRKYIENFENQILSFGKLDSVNFSFEPILKYDSNFTNAFKILKKNNYNHYIDMSLIIDLTKNENQLFKNIRTNYKAPIKKETLNLNLKIVDAKSIIRDRYVFDDWIRSYSNAINKGNKVLSKEAYDALTLSIKNNEVIIFCSYQNSRFLGGNLFSILNNIPSYSLGVVSYNAIQNNQRYVSHYLMWQSILYFKHNSFLYLEIDTSCLSQNKSEKEKNISFFKNGFGATYYPQYFFNKIL